MEFSLGEYSAEWPRGKPRVRYKTAAQAADWYPQDPNDDTGERVSIFISSSYYYYHWRWVSVRYADAVFIKSPPLDKLPEPEQLKLAHTPIPLLIHDRRYPFFAFHKKPHTRFGDASAGGCLFVCMMTHLCFIF